MKDELNLKSVRARQARLNHLIIKSKPRLLKDLAFILYVFGIYLLVAGQMQRLGYVALAIGTLLAIILLWFYYGLRHLSVHLPARRLDDTMEQGLLASLKQPLTPRSAWQAACHNPEALFMCNHLLLDWQSFSQNLSTDEQDTPAVWQYVHSFMDDNKNTELHSGILAAAIILTSPAGTAFLTQNRLTTSDVGEVLDWVERQLSYFKTPKPYFGGIGRDWASGFTPTLDHFGQNISRAVERSGGTAHYLAHNELLNSISSMVGQNSGIALVGPEGTGKTTLIYGLAQRLLEGNDPKLRYYKIISLNASLILSQSNTQIENLVLHLFGEAAAAGNIILFLDDAQLFFGTGTGALDLSQILLPIMRNRTIKIIAAFTAADWQQLQAKQSALASNLASITVMEPNEPATHNIIEDVALGLERTYKTLVSFEAVNEAYRLSGQYLPDQAYPGKAIVLLEQSMPYAERNALSAKSVQTAIEKIKGVKVSTAGAPEADMLLHLEDRIHDRMINQKQAVSVIAAALRRSRAGVASPKRPVGSFLFLGSTGVGKTELAKSLAATYFGDEQRMIRLDMSEYQQPGDVTRLLTSSSQSLLMSVRQQPFSVVLLDEVEKAHPTILNLLLQMLDEGQLTDEQGRPASFRNAIIIATSNAGAPDIAERIRSGNKLNGFERPLIDKLISGGLFKPELVNRFDEVVLFRPLSEEELSQVAKLMLQDVNRTLETQQITVQLTPAALKQIVSQGYDPEFGARPMRRVIQKTVENTVAVKILRQEAQAGSTIILDVPDLDLSDTGSN
jgi:ATP-dependent Clp protease ATP-binding subunit ClpC